MRLTLTSLGCVSTARQNSSPFTLRIGPILANFNSASRAFPLALNSVAARWRSHGIEAALAVVHVQMCLTYWANDEFNCTFLYPPLRLRTCQTASAMVPPVVLVSIVRMRLRMGRMPPDDPVQVAKDYIGQGAGDEASEVAEDDPLQVAEDVP